MTDYSKVKDKLIMLLAGDYEEDGKLDYDGFVKNAVDCIASQVGEEALSLENVIFYFAARALYELRLVESMGADYVSSFKAGDVSFSKNAASCLEQAEKLLNDARAACDGIIPDNTFSFKAV